MGKVKKMAFDELEDFLDSLTTERRADFDAYLDRQAGSPLYNYEEDPLGAMRDMKAGKYKNGGAVMSGRGGKFKGVK